MKRIIMSILLIIMFLPIMITARDINDLEHKWTETLPNSINYFESNNEYTIISTGKNIHKIKNSDGSTIKSITISEGISDIINIDDYLFVYSLSGKYESYKIHIYKLDKNFEIINESSLIIGISYAADKFRIYNNELYLGDYNSGYRIKNDTTIVPLFLNSDGSYWSHSYDTFALYNKNGELIKNVEDIGSDIIKYNDNYIVISEIERKSNEEGKYKLSLYDETLTKAQKTADITMVSYSYNLKRDKNGNVYLENYYYDENDKSKYQYFKISESLVLTEIKEPELFQNDRNKEHIRYNYNESKHYDYQNLTTEESALVDKVLRNYYNYQENYALAIFEEYKDEAGNYIVTYRASHSERDLVNISYIKSTGEIIFTSELFENKGGIWLTYMHGYQISVSVSTKLNDFIYAVYFDNENNYFLKVFDMKGNLLKEEKLLQLSDTKLIWTIKKTENGILIVLDNKNPTMGLSNKNESINPSLLNETPNYSPVFLNELSSSTILIYYEFPYYITTKTDGNGKIKVVEKADSGEEIQYEVIPNDGYKIKEIKVTDQNGKEIIYKNSKFTMPSADVVIEASFVQENVASEKEEVKEEKNPETYDNMWINMTLLFASVLLVTTLSIKYKRLNQ